MSPRVLDLLLADESNPRSIAFQLSTLFRHVRALRVGQASQSDAPGLNLVMGIFSAAARRRRGCADKPPGPTNPSRGTIAADQSRHARTFKHPDPGLFDARTAAASIGSASEVIYQIAHATEYLYATPGRGPATICCGLTRARNPAKPAWRAVFRSNRPLPGCTRISTISATTCAASRCSSRITSFRLFPKPRRGRVPDAHRSGKLAPLDDHTARAAPPARRRHDRRPAIRL